MTRTNLYLIPSPPIFPYPPTTFPSLLHLTPTIPLLLSFWSILTFAYMCIGIGPSIATSLNKTYSYFPSIHHLPKASQLYMKLHEPPPPLSHAVILSSLVLCRSFTCSHSSYAFICVTALSGLANAFTKDTNYFWHFQSFWPFSTMITEPCGVRRYGIDVLFKD